MAAHKATQRLKFVELPVKQTRNSTKLVSGTCRVCCMAVYGIEKSKTIRSDIVVMGV